MSEADRVRRAREAFVAIVDLEPADAEQSLAALYGADPELAQAVELLLAADRKATRFLEAPAAAVAPSLVDEALGPHEAPPVLGQRIGAYRTLELLGRGGMGEVYLAERIDGQFERRVALKLVKRGLDSERIAARFLRERQILARLDHPNIARLLDGGVAADGRPFFVLEWVDGTPITDYCRSRELSLEQRLRLVVTCCDAVDTAHRSLVVHRDLKPSNILVTEAGEVKLLDFGIAKVLGEGEDDEGDLTRHGERVLTPAYAAPEQILGEPVTTATDVYALGAVLYELLTGALPHDRRGTSVAELAGKVTRETVERPSTALRKAEELGPERERRRRAQRLRGDLDTILLMALRRERERRYPTAAAFGDDLRRHLASLPVRARPDTLTYRTGKLLARHRVGAAASALALLSLLSGLTAALWQARLARQQAERADAQAQRSERVKSFLVALFREADPVKQTAPGEVTVRELLERGVTKAEAELRGEPAVLAEVLGDFASLQGNLGQPQVAVRLAERSLALSRTLYGAEDARLSEPLGTLVDALLQEGEQLDRAGAVAEERLRLAELTTGRDSLETAQAKVGLVNVYLHQGKTQPALPLIRDVVRLYGLHFGPGDPRTTFQSLNLGAVLTEVGEVEEAATTLRNAVPLFEEAYGKDHVRLAYLLMNLAEVEARRGRLRDSEAHLGRSLAIQRRQVGEDNALYVTALLDRAAVRREAGRVTEAEADVTSALAVAERIGHVLLARAQSELGLLRLDQGRPTDAVAELETAFAVAQERLGDEHPTTWTILAELGHARQAAGDLGRAGDDVERAVRRLEELGNGEDERILRPLLHLAEVRRTAGRVAEAQEAAKRAATLAAKYYGPEAPRTVRAREATTQSSKKLN